MYNDRGKYILAEQIICSKTTETVMIDAYKYYGIKLMKESHHGIKIHVYEQQYQQNRKTRDTCK